MPHIPLDLSSLRQQGWDRGAPRRKKPRSHLTAFNRSPYAHLWKSAFCKPPLRGSRVTDTLSDPKEIVVQPNGDLVIKVGEWNHEQSITVSASVVSMVSPVFRSELASTYWTDGQTRVVELPHEDPQAVLDFCHLCHHQSGEIKNPSGARLIKLAIWTDNRLAKEALGHWFEATISSQKRYLSHSEFVGLSGLFEFGKEFWQATQDYLTHGTCDLKPLGEDAFNFTSTLNDGRDISIYDLLSVVRKQCIESFFKDVHTCIGRDVLDSGEGINQECCPERYVVFLQALGKYGIRACEFADFPGSLSTAVEIIRDLTDPVKRPRMVDGMLGERSEYLYSQDESCSYCARDIVTDLRRIADFHLDAVPGLDFHAFMQRRQSCFTNSPPSE